MTSYYDVRNHSEVNMIKLYDKLSNESWNAIYDTDNVDEAHNNFMNTVSTLYNECCLYRNAQSKKFFCKPWTMMHVKRKSLCVKCLSNRSKYNECKHKKYNNKLIANFRQSKKKKFSSLINMHS